MDYAEDMADEAIMSPDGFSNYSSGEGGEPRGRRPSPQKMAVKFVCQTL